MERTLWTPEQDKILKSLYEKLQLNRWSSIAEKMKMEYKLPPRTGKQCRERYNNHLNPLLVKEEWSPQEEQQLFRLHDQMGNKWAIIASKIRGRTDNGVKNCFFAKLRKSMRRINSLIKARFKKELKEIKLNVLYKIVEAFQDRFKKEPLCSLETSEFSRILKNRILQMAQQGSQEVSDGQFKELIDQIHNFGKTYKRKPKQMRRIPSNKDHQVPEEASFQYESDKKSEDEIIRSTNNVSAIKIQSQETIKRDLRSATMRVELQDMEKEYGEKQGHCILKGLLQQDDSNEYIPMNNYPLSKRESSDIIGDSVNQDGFFDQSELGLGIPPSLQLNHNMKSQSIEESLFKTFDK